MRGLSEGQKRELKQLYRAGASLKALGRQFGIGAARAWVVANEDRERPEDNYRKEARP